MNTTIFNWQLKHHSVAGWGNGNWKTAALLAGLRKSKLSHPHSNQPCFGTIFLRSSEPSRFGKIIEKPGKPWLLHECATLLQGIILPVLHWWSGDITSGRVQEVTSPHCDIAVTLWYLGQNSMVKAIFTHFFAHIPENHYNVTRWLHYFRYVPV